MTLYLSTFISGAEPFIAKALPSFIADAGNVAVSDGCVTYGTSGDIRDVIKVPFFNNSFKVLYQSRSRDLKAFIKTLTNADIGFKPVKSFKVFCQVGGKLTHADGKAMAALVDKISACSGGQFKSMNAAVQFWIILRTDGSAYFLQRVTPDKGRLKQGQLRPELAAIMCLLSNPRPDDVFIDPFCGSGAIPLMRGKLAGYKGIFAADVSQELAARLKARVKAMKGAKTKKSFFVKSQDFFTSDYSAGFFSVMVTDPPWGKFEEIPADFYPRFFQKAYEILSDGGRLVMLAAAGADIEKAAGKFKMMDAFNILLNGQKAAVWVFRK